MVAVRPEKGENIERAIRRFVKKCKNLRIVEGCREREYYKKPSVKRREARARRKRVLEDLKLQDNSGE
jgi:small subunit ribosomal protein S21